MRQRSSSGRIEGAVRRRRRAARAALVVALFCAVSLVGCTGAGTCRRAITTAPTISVDVTSWVEAHPGTNVRVCADGHCQIGFAVVAITMGEPDTPPRDGDSIAITADPVEGSTAVASFGTTATLVHDRCGQRGVWLRMDDAGRLTASSPDGTARHPADG